MYSSGRSSRPSSATSFGSRVSQLSHSSQADAELKLECKAAYLSVFDDITDDITKKSDFILVLQQAGRTPTPKMLKKYWNDNKDSMSFDQFVDVCKREPPTSEDDLLKAFRKIDINGDGYISLEELYKILTTKGERLTRQEVKLMIDEVDENKDGKLDYKEFCRMFLTTAEECKKISLKVMEKKEQRKKRKEDPHPPTAMPRRVKERMKDEDSAGIKGGEEKSKENEKEGEKSEEPEIVREMSVVRSGSQISLSQHSIKSERKLSQSSIKTGGKDIEKPAENQEREAGEKGKASRSGSHISLLSQESGSSERKSLQPSMKSEKRDREIKQIKNEEDGESGKEEELETEREAMISWSESHSSLLSQRSVKSERKASQGSLKPGERMLSQSSLRSVGLTGSRQSLLSIDDLPKPSPRVQKDKTLPHIGRLSEPKNLREWKHLTSKGCFFVDEDKGYVSHQYQLTLSEDMSVWFTIQPAKIGDHGGDVLDKPPIDTALYILRDDEADDDALVTFTEQRDNKGRHGVRCDLTSGSYQLVPFTTGCRLQPRKSEPSKEAKLVTKDKDDKIVLTRPFRKALEEIFDIADLDGNGLLSREEFNWFNIRTSDDAVADDEWQVVEENVEMKSGEITREGFLQLNQMEAEDNDGETEDLWITLNNMGYNKVLEMDEACPFLLEVYAEERGASLTVTKLENPGKLLENAVFASVVAKGEANKVKAMKDLTLYTYIGDARASLAVENKSRTSVTLELDCNKSRNCITNQDGLICSIPVPAMSKKVCMHLLPKDEKAEWSVRCTETILK